jgi:TRAP-type uncharacterized transport system fused permease subunit
MSRKSKCFGYRVSFRCARLKMSYLDIVRMAIIPTCLYHFGLQVKTEIDSPKYNLCAVDPQLDLTMRQLLMRHGFYFSSLISVVVLMIWGLLCHLHCLLVDRLRHPSELPAFR